jgi:peptidoglycan hydrolase CwlO-like protein
MKRFLFALLTVALSAGCGARVEVVKKTVLDKLDDLIGKTKVARQQIEDEMKGLNAGVDGIRAAKNKARVKQDQFKAEAEPIQEQIAKVDKVLKLLRPHLEATTPVEIAGKTYAPAEIKETAAMLLKERKRLSDKADALKSVETSLEQTASALERQQNEYQKRLQKMESQVAQIDAQLIALNAKHEAAAVMGSTDDSLSRSVDGLQDKVNNLLAETKADLQSENEKWNETAANKEIDSLDATLSKFKGSADTAAEIDKALGGSK